MKYGLARIAYACCAMVLIPAGGIRFFGEVCSTHPRDIWDVVAAVLYYLVPNGIAMVLGILSLVRFIQWQVMAGKRI